MTPGSRAGVAVRTRPRRRHQVFLVFLALWTYGLAFGLLALAGVLLLNLVMDASRGRTIAELSIIVMVITFGTYLSSRAIPSVREFVIDERKSAIGP